jgi:hypothetical protein
MENPEPRRTAPRTERQLPKDPKFRSDTAAPILLVLRSDIEEPKWAKLQTDKDDPKRPRLRKDTADPKVRNDTALTEAPIRA